MQLPCASRRLAGGTNVVAVEAGSALSLCIWLVCGHKLAKWTTNPITRLCSPWLPLHFRLCPLIRDLSKSPNQISPIPPLLSSLLFLSVLNLFSCSHRLWFHRLYLAPLENFSSPPTCIQIYSDQLLEARKGQFYASLVPKTRNLEIIRLMAGKGRLRLEWTLEGLRLIPFQDSQDPVSSP